MRILLISDADAKITLICPPTRKGWGTWNKGLPIRPLFRSLVRPFGHNWFPDNDSKKKKRISTKLSIVVA